jgi:hypothetical protein
MGKKIIYWNGWRFIGWWILVIITFLFICTSYYIDLLELFPKMLNIVEKYPNIVRSVLLSLLVIIPFVISEAHKFRKFLQCPCLFFIRKGKCESLKNDCVSVFL